MGSLKGERGQKGLGKATEEGTGKKSERPSKGQGKGSEGGGQGLKKKAEGEYFQKGH